MAESLARPSPLRRFGGRLARLVAALALMLLAGWAELAVWFQAPLPPGLRIAVATVFACVFALTALTILARRWLEWSLPAAVLFGAALMLWWSGIAPRDDRDWRPDVARKSVLTIRGDDLEVRNVRVFDWSGPDDAEPRWENRLYSLSDLRALDMFTSTWGDENIAHVLLSFSFVSGPPLALSLEIRRERDEEYSPLAGFFKKYELALIAADERDIVKVRSNRRGETVRRYRIDVRPENAAKLLAAYAELSQELDRAPRFYNTFGTNCTTAVHAMLRRIAPGDFPLDIRVLLSGKVAEYLYGLGFIENVQPFPEVRRRADITMQAKLAEHDPDFSAAIRR